jgi:hypothetical protein
MHHYRCQNVYISATASKRIVDTLDPPPHNSSMPQLSSTDRLLMATNYRSNTLKHPHPEVPFAHIGDDKITALTKLAEIFKNKFQKPKSPELTNAPLKAANTKRPAALTQPVLTSPMQHKYQTRSQIPINTKTTSKTPLLPRVVTPMTGQVASPKVPARTPPPRNLSQDDLWNMETSKMSIALGTNHWSHHYFANAVIHTVIGKKMEYMALMNDPDLQPLWKRGFSNEAGRLFQGIHDIPGTNTCLLVLKNIPKDRKITNGKIVCDYKPHKKEKERVRLTVGGDRLDYSDDVATSTSDITTFKFLINSKLSTEDAEMMMMDIKNYCRGNPLPRYEYMHMLLSRFPEEIVSKYNLTDLAVDGWVYIEIRKGMYISKQAGLLDNKLLQKLLAPFGYYLSRHTPGLWLHKTRPIAFSLIVDDFAVKYVGKHHADHLRDALLRRYELTTDWEGKVYSGMSLKWDYKNRTCDISMPGYVANVLSKFQHDAPKHPQHTPSRYVTLVYSTKTQYATQDENPPLTAKKCLKIQQVTGSVLYYARAVDPTVLMPLNDIATEQTKATEKNSSGYH